MSMALRGRRQDTAAIPVSGLRLGGAVTRLAANGGSPAL